jgi:hypothetical protein
MKDITPVIFMFVSLFTLEIFALQSQSPKSTGRVQEQQQMPNVQDILEGWSQRLNLSDDQQARIRVALEDQLARLQSIGRDESLSRQNKRRDLF